LAIDVEGFFGSVQIIHQRSIEEIHAVTMIPISGSRTIVSFVYEKGDMVTA
jgi:hypothetical protein